MSYLVIIAKNAFRVSGKLLPVIKNLIVKELELISKNPYQTPKLTGKFAFLRSQHTYIQGVPYRIIFEIEEKTKKVFIHLIAKRADVYRLIDRLFR